MRNQGQIGTRFDDMVGGETGEVTGGKVRNQNELGEGRGQKYWPWGRGKVRSQGQSGGGLECNMVGVTGGLGEKPECNG